MTLFDVADSIGSEPATRRARPETRWFAPPSRRPRPRGRGPHQRAPEEDVGGEMGGRPDRRLAARPPRRRVASEDDRLAGRTAAHAPPLRSPRSATTSSWSGRSTLSERYLVGVRPASVRWVTNQTARWGSCSYYSGHIRISHRLRVVPGWVLDSVLVHEVAHLTHADHSPAFHRLAAAFPRHEEAGVFLAGYGLGLSNPVP